MSVLAATQSFTVNYTKLSFNKTVANKRFCAIVAGRSSNRQQITVQLLFQQDGILLSYFSKFEQQINFRLLLRADS